MSRRIIAVLALSMTVLLAGCSGGGVDESDPEASASNTGVAAAFEQWDQLWTDLDCTNYERVVHPLLAETLGLTDCNAYATAFAAGGMVVTERTVTSFFISNVSDDPSNDPALVGKEVAVADVTEIYATGDVVDGEYRLLRVDSGWQFIDYRVFD